MDRTWSIEVRIKMGGEERVGLICTGNLPSTGGFAKGSKAYQTASEIIFDRMLAAAREAIRDFGYNNWLEERSSPRSDMGSRPFSD